MRRGATETIANGEKGLTVSEVDDVSLLLRQLAALSDMLRASGTDHTTDIMEKLDKIRAMLNV